VTQNTSGLVYNKQSGALNEAVSDIFGTFVEHAFSRARPELAPRRGLSLNGSAFRDMIHPANGISRRT